MKLCLASLDIKIAHVYGVGVAVHGRFVWVTADVKHDFQYRTRLKQHRQRLPKGSPLCVPASSTHTPV